MSDQYPRDLVGYGGNPPDAGWPGGARLALSFVLEYEEGGESTPLEGDATSEAFLHELVGVPPSVGRRNLNVESMYEYGSRAGFWRVHRIFTGHDTPVTVFAVGQALERNPQAARAMVAAGWELAGHHYRYIDYLDMPEDQEREHVRRTIEAIRQVSGQPPVGWFTGRFSDNTRRLLLEEADLLYECDVYADDLPYWIDAEGTPVLLLPFTLDANDLKFAIANNVATADEFFAYLRDSFDQLYEEGGRMMTVGVHGRAIGRPGRAPALTRFLEHVGRHPDVWVTTRAEIARHWRETHPARARVRA